MLAGQLAKLETRGLKRHRRVLQSPQGAHVTVDGRKFVAFCSNDYLGLAAHPGLVRAAQEGAGRYGIGTGASHLILGHSMAHQALEEALSGFMGLPRALLFSAGYMANIGIVTALMGRDDAVFADKLNHASLNDAVLLSRARFKRYPHLDLAVLERLLAASPARRKLVVTDAVFSMDGDLACRSCWRCASDPMWLMLDDAHGFGCWARTAGHAVAFGDPLAARDLHGARQGGSIFRRCRWRSGMIETLIQRARSYIYTTATPPLLSHAL